MGLVLASREGPFSSIIGRGVGAVKGRPGRKWDFNGEGWIWKGAGSGPWKGGSGRFDLGLGRDLTWDSGLGLWEWGLGLGEILALGIETAQVFFSHFSSWQYPPRTRARKGGGWGGKAGKRGWEIVTFCNIL